MYKSFFGNIGGNLVLFKVHFRHFGKNGQNPEESMVQASWLLRSLIPFRMACFFRRRVGRSMAGIPSSR